MIPLVSVVTSTYNGAAFLEQSLQSVLSQKAVEIELIVVDDGSTDESSEILSRLSNGEPRLRVIRQENSGLTQALIRGCAEARGVYIARHDSDDISLPTRLERQVEALAGNPALSLVSCRARAIGPRDEPLYVSGVPERGKSSRPLGGGPAAHGSTMFRTETFRSVGGYRREFRYAQDWDLWLRLSEKGDFTLLPELLYCYRIGEFSISASRRGQQNRLGQAALRCAEARLSGLPEAPYLEEAERISNEVLPKGRRQSNNYFIGNCLVRNGDLRGLRYLWAALVAPICR
jgi:glycosyltransferase involved in cell wall biosynthesis